MKSALAMLVVFLSLAIVACGHNPIGSGGPPVSFVASPSAVNVGGSSLLTWSSEASSCQAGGAWSGSKNPSGGAESVGPITVTSTYTLTCVGTNGASTTATVTVTVGVAGVCNDPLAKNKGQVGVCDYTYYSPEGIYPDGRVLQKVPANSFTATVTGISPVPGSTLHAGQTARIDITHAIAASAPVLDPTGSYTVYYDWVDQAGNVVNNSWLSGPTPPYAIGTAGPNSQSTLVYGTLPANLYGWRIRWSPGNSGFVLIPDPGSQLGYKLDPISVTIVVDWHIS